jgi:hypothetical protein
MDRINRKFGMASLDTDAMLPSALCSEPSLPALPPDVARMIFERLEMKDLCSAAQASKVFWTYTCHVTYLRATFRYSPYLSTFIHSFTTFVRRRLAKGLKVPVNLTSDGLCTA